LCRILDVWRGLCSKSQVDFPSQAHNELKRKISGAELKKTPATLDFASCELSDATALLLIEVLAMRPVIAQLTLAYNNLSSEVSRSSFLCFLLVG
jgi:hypothetical protein